MFVPDNGPMFVGVMPKIVCVLNTCMSAEEIRRLITLLETPEAYHGTPYDIDRFSTDKIGTGEGAQVYGWGLYFASSDDVALWYRDKLTDFDEEMRTDAKAVNFNGKIIPTSTPSNKLSPIERAALDYFYSGNDLHTAITDLKHSLQYMKPNGEAYKMDLETLQALEDGKESGVFFGKVKPARGNFYKVNIIPTDEKFLLWDVSLSQQTPYVKQCLAKMGVELTNEIAGGAAFYKRMAVKLGSAKAASLELLKHGIHGNRYLDGSSRRRGEGSYNYVVFDDKDVEKVADE